MAMSNCGYGWEALKTFDFLAVIDMWHTPMLDMADVVMPCVHWLEAESPRCSQGASGGIGATCKCIELRESARSTTRSTSCSGKPWAGLGTTWRRTPNGANGRPRMSIWIGVSGISSRLPLGMSMLRSSSETAGGRRRTCTRSDGARTIVTKWASFVKSARSPCTRPTGSPGLHADGQG